MNILGVTIESKNFFRWGIECNLLPRGEMMVVFLFDNLGVFYFAHEYSEASRNSGSPQIDWE